MNLRRLLAGSHANQCKRIARCTACRRRHGLTPCATEQRLVIRWY